jgi:putative transposase
VERLWRSVKYEEVYLKAYRDGIEARKSLAAYFDCYNCRRLHEALDYHTPEEVYLSARKRGYRPHKIASGGLRSAGTRAARRVRGQCRSRRLGALSGS